MSRASEEQNVHARGTQFQFLNRMITKRHKHNRHFVPDVAWKLLVHLFFYTFLKSNILWTTTELNGERCGQPFQPCRKGWYFSIFSKEYSLWGGFTVQQNIRAEIALAAKNNDNNLKKEYFSSMQNILITLLRIVFKKKNKVYFLIKNSTSCLKYLENIEKKSENNSSRWHYRWATSTGILDPAPDTRWNHGTDMHNIGSRYARKII